MQQKNDNNHNIHGNNYNSEIMSNLMIKHAYDLPARMMNTGLACMYCDRLVCINPNQSVTMTSPCGKTEVIKLSILENTFYILLKRLDIVWTASYNMSYIISSLNSSQG